MKISLEYFQSNYIIFNLLKLTRDIFLRSTYHYDHPFYYKLPDFKKICGADFLHFRIALSRLRIVFNTS